MLDDSLQYCKCIYSILNQFHGIKGGIFEKQNKKKHMTYDLPGLISAPTIY